MPQNNLGRVAFKFKGDYSPGTTYTKYDVVFDGESSYVSLIDANTGNLLTDVTKWEYLAKGNALLSEQNALDIAQTRADLNLDEYTLAEALNFLYSKINSLEKLISDGLFGNLQVDILTTVKELNYNGAPLILTGTTAPTTAPDFVGQTYINTTSPGTVYTAKGIGTTADWKQTSN